MEAHRERDDIMKKLITIIIIAGVLLAAVPPVSAGEPTTTEIPPGAVETVTYTGTHPIKDAIDLKTSAPEKKAALDTALYTAWEKQTFPVKFTSSYGDAITIKKIEKKMDGTFGVYISATRGGKDIATRSPIWIYNPPTVIVTDITVVSQSAFTTTVKEDVVSVIENTISEVVHNTKTGTPKGDDTVVIYASNDGYPQQTTDAAWATVRDGAGETVTNNPSIDLYSGWTIATTTSDVISTHAKAIININSSVLGSSVTIDSAVVSAYGLYRSKNLGYVEFVVIDASPANSHTFAAGDYDSTTNTLMSDTKIAYADFLTTGYNNFTLNSKGIGNISKTGNTTFMFDHTASVNKSALVWASGATTGYAIRSVRASSGAYKPFITITYTTAGGDTTPPLSITGLTNTTATTCSSINFTWVNPSDADFNHTMIYRNNTFLGNFSNSTTYQYWTGLPTSTEMTISTHTADITGNVNTTWVNASYTLPACPDTTPPASITNLANITTCNSVNWTWTPPGDADFAGVAVYNNTGSGAWYHNVTTPYDLWTSLSELAPYGIGTHTYDSTGNINSTWVNQTAYTGACGSAPVAAFSGNKTSLVRGEYVQFTDTSSNTPTAWNWTLGDGNVSSTQSPLFQYNVAGTFDVKLYASNAYGGDWENKTAYITVSEPGSPPVAAFSVDDTTVCYGSSATFTDASTNTPTGWYWEFGEGNTSSSQNPTKTYNVLGAMNVNLKATNAYGSDWENKTGYITVSDCSAPPTICILGVNCEQRWVRIA